MSRPLTVAERIALSQEEIDPVIALLIEMRDEIRATKEQIPKNGNGNGNGKKFDRFWQVVAAVVTAVLVASIFGWVNLERRVSLIESNRFTAEMARQMEARILTGVPPVWFQQLVAENTRTLNELEVRMRQVENGRNP